MWRGGAGTVARLLEVFVAIGAVSLAFISSTFAVAGFVAIGIFTDWCGIHDEIFAPHSLHINIYPFGD